MKNYHYTESGLNSVWLANGFEIVKSAKGTGLKIHDIDGLHAAIGNSIVERAKRLSGDEFRFLRVELLYSQARLATLFQVTPLTVARWEKGATKIPASTDATLRALYQEKNNRKAPTVGELLLYLTELELEAEARKLVMEEGAQGWSQAA